MLTWMAWEIAILSTLLLLMVVQDHCVRALLDLVSLG